MMMMTYVQAAQIWNCVRISTLACTRLYGKQAIAHAAGLPTGMLIREEQDASV